MEGLFDSCSGWTDVEIDYLKIYINARNRVRAISEAEVNENILYRSVLYSVDDDIEINEPFKVHTVRKDALESILFWVALLSAPNSSIIDLECLRNEINVFIEDVTSYLLESGSESKSPKPSVAEETTETISSEDIPTKRPRIDK